MGIGGSTPPISHQPVFKLLQLELDRYDFFGASHFMDSYTDRFKERKISNHRVSCRGILAIDIPEIFRGDVKSVKSI